MSERLTDEQVARALSEYGAGSRAASALREVQTWRELVPGIIDRLQRELDVCDARSQAGLSTYPEGLAAIIATLREAVGT